MPKIEVSVGELIDKITILEIKQDRITDETKLSHINAELGILRATAEEDKILIGSRTKEHQYRALGCRRCN